MDIRRKILELAKEYGIAGTGNIENHKNDIVILIKHLPFFYDHTDPNYKSLASRDHAWSALADIFKTSKDDVKFKWKSLRECYRRQQLRQQAARKKRKIEPEHPLLIEMAYLDDVTARPSEPHGAGDSSTDHEYYIMQDDASSEVETQNETTECMDQDDEEEVEEEESFTLSDSDLEYEEDGSEEHRYSISKTAKHSMENNDPLMVKDLDDKYNLFADVKDVEDFLFAKLVAHELRKITCPVKRLQVKAEILRIIASYAKNE